MKRLTRRDNRERLASLERAIKKLGDAQRDQAATLRSDVARAASQQVTAKDLRELRQDVQSLGLQLDRPAPRSAKGGTLATPAKRRRPASGVSSRRAC